MVNPGERLLRWWRTASVRARWMAGLALASVVMTGLLVVMLDLGSPAAAVDSVPVARGGSDFSPLYFVGVAVKLVGVLALIVGGAVLYRRYTTGTSKRGPRNRMNLVETLRISPRQALHLVRVGDQVMLVGATDQSMSLLSVVGLELDTPEAEGKPAAAPITFQAVLQSLAERSKNG